MNRLAARIAGFAIPTVGLVTAIHLGRQAGWGEGLAGVASGAWFTLPFAATCWLRSRLEGRRKRALARSAVHELALGVMSGAVTWAILWLGWTFPEATAWRPHAFTINSVATGLAGLALPAAGRRVRPEPNDVPAESTPGRA